MDNLTEQLKLEIYNFNSLLKFNEPFVKKGETQEIPVPLHYQMMRIMGNWEVWRNQMINKTMKSGKDVTYAKYLKDSLFPPIEHYNQWYEKSKEDIEGQGKTRHYFAIKRLYGLIVDQVKFYMEIKQIEL